MASNQLVLDTLEMPFVSKNLFTKHFLLNRLPKHPLWESSISEATKVRDEIFELYNKNKKNLPNMNESQLELEFIRKVLEKLGHKDSFTVQAAMLLGFGKFKKPDYVYFKDEEAKNEAYKLRTKEPESFYSRATAIGEAKEWGSDLDKKPSTQIMTYLKFGGVRWGILTNGRKWRIYHKENKIDNYYEVDLLDHLENGNEEKFNYFYLFFRKEAFITTETKERCFLDDVLAGSLRFAQQLEDDVRDNVYMALRILCEGFLKYPKNDLQAEDLSKIRESCLILLYRLLFILYAESKKLLPLEDPIDRNEYGSISLEALRKEVANIKKGRKVLPTLDTHWTHLQRLFEFINEGSEKQGVHPDELFITSYNGGLFDPERQENIFLEEMKIGNQYLDEALDLLSRSNDEEGRLVEVDYDTLSIRHLGSIYEGLLEYKVVTAEKDLAEVEGIDTYVPLKTAINEKKKIITSYQKGVPILQTDKGERKATGSYYTPDYIVKYIVQNTVGPLIKEKRMEWESSDMNYPLWMKYLELRVLDPAMGSGHFLVEVVNFIGEEVLHAWTQHYEEVENPPPNEGTIEWARHEVVRHCVFGVDLNPLAVELAKLSLWLATVQVNRPLSFLDHHLKCGNSLIGTKMNELAWYLEEKPKETTIPPLIIENLESAIDKINTTSDESLEGVKEQEALYNKFKETQEYLRMKTLAGTRVSLFFDNKIESIKPKEVYNTFVKTTFEGDEQLWRKRIEQNWIKRAEEIAEEKKFFHWELEFPEIYFEEGKPKERPGFDAVVGNPPYVRIYRGVLPEDDVLYYKKNFISAHMKFDLYIVFFEQAHCLTKKGGYYGYIVPDKFMNNPYGKNLRILFLKETRIHSFLDLRKENIFPEVAVSNVIPILKKHDISNDYPIKIMEPDFSKLPSVSYIVKQSLPVSIFNKYPDKSFRLDTLPHEGELTQKIDRKSIKLRKIYYTNWGLRTGTAEKTTEMINNEKLSINYKPLIRGEDILDRYRLIFNKNYIDYDIHKLYNPMFKPFFESPKIVFRKISGPLGLIASYDEDFYYGFSTVIIGLNQKYVAGYERQGVPKNPSKESLVYTNDHYLLALVNSKLIRWYHRKILYDQLSVVPNQINELPIRQISFSTRLEHRDSFKEEAKKLYRQYFTTRSSMFILDFVKSTEKKKNDVIHDLLAYLAECMLDLNKIRQTAIIAFKTDLEGVLGDKIGKISRLYTPPKEPVASKYRNEAKLQERIEKYDDRKMEAEELLGKELANKKLELEDFPILSEDQLKELLRKKLGKVTNLAQILMIFQRYRDEIEIESDIIAKGKVKGLKSLYTRIDTPYEGSTDWLIDQIVYELYGLTDEEIAIVEESFNN